MIPRRPPIGVFRQLVLLQPAECRGEVSPHAAGAVEQRDEDALLEELLVRHEQEQRLGVLEVGGAGGFGRSASVMTLPVRGFAFPRTAPVRSRTSTSAIDLGNAAIMPMFAR